MIEKWRKALDNGKLAGALLTDFSKAFDFLNNNVMIVKLHAYGFDHNSLTYVSGRKQMSILNNSLSSWAPIKTGVPQGSIWGPHLLNMYINDIFFFIKENELTNYADDNTPYAINSEVDKLIESLENDSSITIKWFSHNDLVMNADKSHLLVTNHHDNVSLVIDKEFIEGNKVVKLLGITIDNKLNFTEHLSNICKKVIMKLHALARI